MTPREKELIQALQQISKAAMVLANSSIELVMNVSPVAERDLDHQITIMEACIATAKKIRGKPLEVQTKEAVKIRPTPKQPITPPKRDSQDFLEVGEKVKVKSRFIEVVWASQDMNDRYYAELRSKKGVEGTVILTPNGFTLSTPRTKLLDMRIIEVMGTNNIVRDVYAQLFSEE